MGDAVQHAMFQQIFGALESFGQLFADGLFDDPGACETDQGIRFGDVDIAQHRIAGRHPARGRMGQHDDIGDARFLEHLDRDGGAGHLHQRQDALLHARATGGGEEDQRLADLDRAFGGGDDGIADIHAHGPAHEAEVLTHGDDRRPADLSLGDQHGLFFAGGFLRGLHAVGIFLLVPELQRVDDRIGNLHLDEGAAVEQRAKAFARGDPHMVIAVRADVQIVRQFPVEQHGPAFGAFGPQILGHIAAREQRVDARADIVRDPVHREWPWLFQSLN
ncbi:hypothetical protein PANO111632_14890 [Paracoccus nototheniae]